VRAAKFWAALGCVAGLAAGAETFVWVDEAGVTHLSNDSSKVPLAVLERDHDPEAVRQLWAGPVGDRPGARGVAPQDRAEARVQRALRAAVADLQRGENARAAAQLRDLLREQPARPEPHWYLALLDRHRGRYDSAAAHLDAFLAHAGDDLEAWRASARRQRAVLADERSLAQGDGERGDEPWSELASRHFRVQVDPELGRLAPSHPATALRYLDEARRATWERLGTQPDEPLGVVFYARAAYDRAHAERFSFRTVGFFDGRIHVVSAAHPGSELRALLFHEYVHAVFRERTGGDRPYWLNEGLAELSERDSRRQPGLTHSDRSLLARRIDAGEWISLRRLAPGFSGLDDDDARAAYLEATAAAAWLAERSEAAGLARVLDALGAGRSDDEALLAELGMDTGAIDRGVRAWIASEFAGRFPRPGSLAERH